MTQSYLAPEIEDQVEASLPVAEFDRLLPQSEEEIQASLELIEWFTRRYPTVKERLAYARRTFDQWTRPSRIAPRSDP